MHCTASFRLETPPSPKRRVHRIDDNPTLCNKHYTYATIYIQNSIEHKGAYEQYLGDMHMRHRCDMISVRSCIFVNVGTVHCTFCPYAAYFRCTGQTSNKCHFLF